MGNDVLMGKPEVPFPVEGSLVHPGARHIVVPGEGGHDELVFVLGFRPNGPFVAVVVARGTLGQGGSIGRGRRWTLANPLAGLWR